MNLVHVRHRVVTFGEVAYLGNRRDVAVHGVQAFEDDQLVAAVARGAKEFLEMGDIVVAEDHPLRRGAADALDHGIVVQRIREDEAIREKIGDRGDGGEVGNPAGGEDQRTVFAVQIREVGLELDERMAGACDVPSAARANAVLGGSGRHRLDHLGVAAHSEIVVGAPDGDVLRWRVAAVPKRAGEMFGASFEIREDAVATLSF